MLATVTVADKNVIILNILTKFFMFFVFQKICAKIQNISKPTTFSLQQGTFNCVEGCAVQMVALLF